MAPSWKRIAIASLLGLVAIAASVALFLSPGYLVSRSGPDLPAHGTTGGMPNPAQCPENDGVLGPAHCETVIFSPGSLQHCGNGPVSSYLFQKVSFEFFRYVPCSPSFPGNNVNVTVTEANGNVSRFEFSNGAPPLVWLNWTSPDESVAIGWLATTWNFTLVVAEGGYSVTFTEVGLPAETNWTVTLNGSLAWSYSDSIVFIDLNGTYAFTSAATGYTEVSSLSSPLTVSGNAVSVTVTFAPNLNPTVGQAIAVVSAGPP
ncbi:MAG: hypothetical protein WCA77_02090 [Thermoplasmata archaeon]